jgi:hypothetical protein
MIATDAEKVLHTPGPWVAQLIAIASAAQAQPGIPAVRSNVNWIEPWGPSIRKGPLPMDRLALVAGAAAGALKPLRWGQIAPRDAIAPTGSLGCFPVVSRSRKREILHYNYLKGI